MEEKIIYLLNDNTYSNNYFDYKNYVYKIKNSSTFNGDMFIKQQLNAYRTRLTISGNIYVDKVIKSKRWKLNDCKIIKPDDLDEVDRVYFELYLTHSK